MATQTKRPQDSGANETIEGTAALAAAAGTVTEVYRQQLAAGAQVLGSIFRSAEALQQVQLQMNQRLALLHGQAADNIRRATSPVELASVQSTLGLYQLQEAMRYGQEVLAALAKSGGELMRPAQAAQDGAAATATVSPAATMMDAAMNVAAPMADAFQQMFTGQMKAAAAAAQPRH